MIGLFPKTKVAWTRCGILFAILLGVCAYRNVFTLWQLAVYRPQDGDIVFQSLPHGSLVDAIEGVTGSPWSHCGIVVHEHGLWLVAEAIGHVRKTWLPLWIIRGRKGHFEAYRPTVSPPAGNERLHVALDYYMGRPYDYHYAPGDREIYCSELIYDAYQDAYGVKLGEWQRLRDLNWRPYESFIRLMEETAPPLDRLIISPAALTRSPLVKKVYPAAGF